ncbi:MAG: SCO2521 family protein [Kibdelosporangium sp.]
MLVFGEIRTCLLQNSHTVPRSSMDSLLKLLPGERVRLSDRPIVYGVSPQTLTGVDCQLANASGARCRGVGTVGARAVVTGGRVLQGSAYVTVERGTTDYRLPWSHYLARPTVVQTTGKFNPADLTDGFIANGSPAGTLDLGAVSEQLISSIQVHPGLDRLAPLRTRRTRVRWAALIETGGPGGTAEFVVADEVVRTVKLTLSGAESTDVIGFCENLALHDWALSTLSRIIERSANGSVEALRPAIDHLLHLWMPGAHVSESLLPLWESLERRPGFTRQWETMVAHIRDRLMSAVVAALNP